MFTASARGTLRHLAKRCTLNPEKKRFAMTGGAATICLSDLQCREDGRQGVMLSIYGNSSGRFCDGLSRRNFLKIGGLGMGGLALPELLKASANSGGGKREKSIIMIYLPGGPPH